MESFLDNIYPMLFRRMPQDQIPKSPMMDTIRAKSRVLYFPIPALPTSLSTVSKVGPLHIVWNHRWEWDKGPDLFFRALFALQEAKIQFVVSVLGEQFGEVPPIFSEAKERLSAHIRHFGYLEHKEQYFDILHAADVCVSTTDHEFFGVSVLEAVKAGCWPLCPNKLVFPELFPSECLYNTEGQLVKKLRYFARYPEKARARSGSIDLVRFEWETLKPAYAELFNIEINTKEQEHSQSSG
jgi:glycosyltransferase involved in cell wall biosynthesis